MEIKYITDTDFLPKELTHFHGLFPKEITDDLYQIVYGILKPNWQFPDVYQLVTNIAAKETIAPIKKFKLMTWKSSLELISKSLIKFQSSDYDVVIYVPITYCEMYITEALDFFQLAIFTLDEMLKGNETPFDSDFKCPEIPNMKQLFESYYSFLFGSEITSHRKMEPLYRFTKDMLPKHDDDTIDADIRLKRKYIQMIICDEMYRRGIKSYQENNNETNITPSPYYNEPYRYKEIFINKDEIHVPGMEEFEARTKANQYNDSFDPSSENIKVRTTIMYHMLSSFLPVTMENKYKVMALFNYAVGQKYDLNKPKEETRNNAVRRYVDDCIKERLPSSTLDFCQSVKNRLKEYGFDVPEIIEKGAEIKRYEKFS